MSDLIQSAFPAYFGWYIGWNSNFFP